MIYAVANILHEHMLDAADAVCFTSNGVVKSNGELVMGAGVAKAFRDQYTGMGKAAGKRVQQNGNICQIIGLIETTAVVAFPTKHHWRDPSDLALIEQSAHQLMAMVNQYNWKAVLLPRPGCSNGGLNWEDVKAVLEPILDDRIIICTKP